MLTYAVWAGNVQPSGAAFTATTQNGVNSFAAAETFCTPTTKSVQPVADTWIAQNEPTTTKGTSTEVRIRSESPRNTRILIRFGLPSVPSGCVVTSARLRLTSSDANTAGRTYDAHVVTTSWSESSTWSTASTIGTSDVATTTSVSSGPVEWTVTTHVQAMYAGSNNGWLVRDRNENASPTAESNFYSREFPTTTSQPQLVVTFG